MKISLALKALCELGPRQLGLFALFRVGLLSGYFRRVTPNQRSQTTDRRLPSAVCRPLLDLPDPAALREVLGPAGIAQLIAEADEIVEGRVRLFGGLPVPLNLTPPGELTHWTDYARGKSAFPNHSVTASSNYPFPDIKFIWEPARFGWAFTLGRAYHLTQDERYPAAFWRYFEIFQRDNLANLGPNWESAQEVALRLIAFTFAARIFTRSGHLTPYRHSQLSQAVADHADRIPPTLVYARAQNNNHLLSEAAGLITAALALPDHPHAKHWHKLGWKWFNRGLETQIAKDGTYMQQSTNYHRLMLQLALWVYEVRSAKCEAPCTPHLALATATQWLLNLCDPESGRVPNLGPNDGAYILPLATLPFSDYRPVLQAASQAFLTEPAFEPGLWDEMSLWLTTDHRPPTANNSQPSAVRCPSSVIPLSTLHAPRSWAYLRAAHFTDRPGHADQLHLDLWWRGLNIAQDAGTYLYNADPPWDNALTRTAVHNTVTLNGQEQMTRAGRFLYLDRAQATWQKDSAAQITAQHNGYEKFGYIHRRTVEMLSPYKWEVRDEINTLEWEKSLKKSRFSWPPHQEPRFPKEPTEWFHPRLHWLLPDWPWEIDYLTAEDPLCYELRLASPVGEIKIRVSFDGFSFSMGGGMQVGLVRAGELLFGNATPSPTQGWISPTYGVKEPALSFSLRLDSLTNRRFLTEFIFPEVE